MCPGSMMGTSDCSLPPSPRLPSPAFKFLSSSSLAPIHEKSMSIWQRISWLPSCMATQRWKVHPLHMSWSTLTQFGKHYIHFSSLKRNPGLISLNCERLFVTSFRRSTTEIMFTVIFEPTTS